MKHVSLDINLPAHRRPRAGSRDMIVATLIGVTFLLWLIVEILARGVESETFAFTPEVAAIFDSLFVFCIVMTIACAIFMADLITTRFLN